MVKPSVNSPHPHLCRMYESRLWRRNPIFSVLLGVSFDKELELIMKVATLKGDETFLDLGCNPGIYTRPFARRLQSGTAVGLDLSMPVLDYAVRRAHADRIKNLLFIHGMLWMYIFQMTSLMWLFAAVPSTCSRILKSSRGLDASST